jgi:hypothetical protein
MKNKRVKKLVKKYFKWWVHWLGLGYWDVTLQFKPGEQPRGGGCVLAGTNSTDWKYVYSCITIYPEAICHLNDAEIEKIVIHELMHTLLQEMSEGGADHEERVATQLQKAFSWVKGASKNDR